MTTGGRESSGEEAMNEDKVRIMAYTIHVMVTSCYQ